VTTYETIVRNGVVVVPELPNPAEVDVAITEGRVAALLDRGQGQALEHEWDAEGCVVMPGAIDPHVHVNWPYLDARTADDYRIASRAAAAGGTTTMIDFAVEGRDDPLGAVLRRRGQAAGASVIDFSLHCVISEATPAVLERIDDVVGLGVTSFKLYMTYRRRGLAADVATIAAVARRVAELGGVVGVHAEDADMDDEGTAAMKELGNGAAHYLPDAKPPIAEVTAITAAADAVAGAGGQLWVLHLSSAAGLAAALAARDRCGQPAALETCPQYLLLDRRSLEGEHGHRFLCSPPLRDPGDPVALWGAVADGQIDWLGTDHCLFLKEQKDRRRDAFWDCPHGLPGIQTRPALMLAAGLDQGITTGRLSELLSKNAASWFGMYPRKGTLLPGSDADLAVWDLNARTRVTTGALQMGGDWTPFEGHHALAPPRLVLVRGLPVVGADVPPPDGWGEFVARPVDRVA
jgi:dihydropyrimidinase